MKIPCCQEFEKIANAYLDASESYDRRLVLISRLISKLDPEWEEDYFLYEIFLILKEILDKKTVLEHIFFNKNLDSIITDKTTLKEMIDKTKRDLLINIDLTGSEV